MINRFLSFFFLSLFITGFIACGDPPSVRGGSDGGEDSTDTPKPPTPNATTIKATGINLYVENSGSMLGYMRGQTEFKDALLDLSSRMRLPLEYFYVNSVASPIGSTTDEFISNLDENTFAKAGRDTKNSRLGEIIKMVSETVTADNKVGILASDFIFNVVAKDPRGDLSKQKFMIKDYVEKLKTQGYGVLIMKFQSMFDGKYYDYSNKPTSYKGYRPFYVWVMAPQSMLTTFMKDYKLDNLKGYRNFAVFYNTDANQTAPYFSILPQSEPMGSMQKSRDSRDVVKTIESLSTDSRNGDMVAFNVAMDLSKLPVDESYLKNPSNYNISSSGNNKFEILEIKPIGNIDIHNNDKKYMSSATHCVKVQTSKIIEDEQDITIQLKKEAPNWIMASSSEDDTNIMEQVEQTFGLKYLVEGVSEAYHLPGTQPVFFDVTMTIKR